MESPDGTGSSTGEGRKGALLLLHGGRPTEGEATSDRASALPSSNALRPDSNLNVGWYRPAAPEEKPPDAWDRNEWSSQAERHRVDEQQSTVTVTATRVDLRADPAATDPSDSPLGARRPRGTPAGSSQRTRRQEPDWHASGSPTSVVWPRSCSPLSLARSVRARWRWALRQCSSSRSLGVAALEQRDNPHRNAAQPGSALASSGRSTPVSHAGAKHQSVSQGSTSASDPGTTAAASPADTTPAQQAGVQQTSVQPTSTQQPVHYQPPAQPAGPAGLGSQVGGNCHPKCS
jgi:hypothetical protein